MIYIYIYINLYIYIYIYSLLINIYDYISLLINIYDYISLLLFLVGTKTDLRVDKKTCKDLNHLGEHIIQEKQGRKLAAKIDAVKYLECSARRGRGLVEVSLNAHRLFLELWLP